VVLPVLLMLGSVYAHVAATRMSDEADRLAEEKAVVEAEAERLQVRVEELSGPERIRREAREDLGMRDPNGKEIRDYEKGGGARGHLEKGTNGGG
jgi:cell division protein FtsL